MSDRNSLSLLPIGRVNADANTLSPVMEQCARNLYRQAWSAYRAVGCPYGPTDKAMLVWYCLHDRCSGPSVTGRN